MRVNQRLSTAGASVAPSFAPVRRLVARLAPETRGLARDSFILSIATLVTMAGYMVQIALITHLLGLAEYGIFALAVAFVDVVGRFFNLQVGDAAIAFASTKLEGEPRAAAGIFQIAYLAEIASGVVAFGVVAALAPFFAQALVGDDGPTLVVLYGLTLVATTVAATSLSLLRLLGRFGTILRLTALREVLRVIALATVLVVFGTLESVAVALVLLEAMVTVLGLAAAARAFTSGSGGVRLGTPALRAVGELRRPMLGMMFHTNLVTYAKLVAAQGPTLLLGALRPPVEVGAYKVATAIASAFGKPADPAWAAVMPRLSRLWAAGRASEIRRLVLQASTIALAGLTALALIATVLREPLLRLFGGGAATVAADILVIAVAAKVVNGVVFWNTPLLYSARRAAVASRAYVVSAAVLAPMLYLFIDAWGGLGAAVALLVFTVQLNVLLTVSAVRTTRALARGAA
jgi:O-antigen/teichoic acid export membrane protein